MDILSATFVENLNIRQAEGGATRIDLTGVMFSMAAPSPVPVTITPHLIVLIRCHPDEPGQATLEVRFRNDKGEDVARNASPFTVEPGKFTYRLVRGELAFEDYGTIEAHCSINMGPTVTVPLTLLPPV